MGLPTADDTELCEECGFVWDEIELEAIGDRLNVSAGQLAAIFASGGAALGQRPSAEVWSAVEYGSHVRDVLLNLRDRLVVGLAEDNPSPKPMHGSLRIEKGMYRVDDPGDIAEDLIVASRLFDRTLGVITASEGERPIFYGWPRPATRTLRWVAAQALHEVEHHLADVQRLVRLVQQLGEPID